MHALWMVVAGFLFAWMGVFVKIGSAHFSSAELVFYRSLVGLVVIYVTLVWRTQGKAGVALATPHWKLHLTRSIAGFIALMLFFYGIAHLPLATAITLNYTSPLFLALLSTLVLKERPRARLLVALVIGFSGVVLLLQPAIHRDELLAATMGLVSGALAGVAYLNVKQLGMAGEPEWRTVFYFTLISTIGGALWMLVHTAHPVTLENVWILLGLGTTATLAQLAMTRAYRLGQTLVVGALAYTTVVFASLLGIFLWGEVLAPLAWAAIAIIVAGGVLSVGATRRR